MWWIYVVVICVIVAVVLAFFIFKRVADKKKYERLTKNLPKTLQTESEEQVENNSENLKEPQEKTEKEQENSANFEDFVFEEEKQDDERHDFSINPFRSRRMSQNGGREKIEQDRQYHGLENVEDDDMQFDDFDDEDSQGSSEDLDSKFAEYEKFLRENLGIDDDEVENAQSDEEDFDDFSDFDFDSLKGKSKAEIDEIIRNMSPKAKEILLSDILARKDYDDDDK